MRKFTDFKDYLVILHNFQKREKRRRVYKAASFNAAVRVANLKERLYNYGSGYTASNCYELDPEGNPLWNT